MELNNLSGSPATEPTALKGSLGVIWCPHMSESGSGKSLLAAQGPARGGGGGRSSLPALALGLKLVPLEPREV